LSDCFINARHSEALVDVTVVENRRAQSFFALILQRENGALVKLLPRTDPEKTDGVRKVVALIAGQLKAQSPACRYGQNNIEGYLG
jgi:hypothetical protein